MTHELRPVVLDARSIAELPTTSLGAREGVSTTVLWTDGTSQSGILRIEAGHRLGTHAHRRHHHHMWVVDGEADVLGRRLGPGGYTHVPPGIDHDVDARATDGCTLYYSYQLPGDA